MPKSKRKRRSNSKTGYIGVRKNARGTKYTAAIKRDGKTTYLGSSFDTAKKAAKAYDKEAIQLRKPLSRLNYPKKAPVGYTAIQQVLKGNNTIGYRGVARNRNKFRASLATDGITTYSTSFETAKEAAIAYDRFVLKANKSTTLLNFPDMVHNLDVEPKRQKYTGSSSGYRGVSQIKSSGKFGVYISIGNGKQRYFGNFDTAIQAAVAYDQAAIKAGKKIFLACGASTLNFPKEEKDQKKQKKQNNVDGVVPINIQFEEQKKKKEKKTKNKKLLTIQEYKEMLQKEQKKEQKKEKEKKTKKKKTKKKKLLTIQEYKEMLHA